MKVSHILAATIVALASWLFSSPAFAVEQPSLAPMLEHVLPCVVSISVAGVSDDESDDDAPTKRSLDKFFGFTNQEETAQRSFTVKGSGVIIDGSGLILTNYHLIENASAIMVGVYSGSTYRAEVVGTDPQTDIAVVKIKAVGLVATRLGDSSRLRVGDYVVAIGTPFGLKQTATLGIVSALDRSGLGLEGLENFIQTDAALNPGNSGGALMNLDGELVGINTAIIGPGGANAGIGFAIPINTARKIAEQLVAHGKIDRGQIGVVVQDLTPDLAKVLTLGTSSGALVSEVLEGSPAAFAGLRQGDAISRVGNVAIADAATLRNAISDLAPGTHVTAKGFRGPKRLEVRLTIGPQRLPDADSPTVLQPGDGALEGVTLQDVFLKPRGNGLGIQVLAVEPDTPAARAGLATGDLIVAVNQRTVGALTDLLPILPQAGDLLLLTVYRDGHALFLVIGRS